MNITNFYLSRENSFCVEGETVEKRLSDSGIDHLWSDRESQVDTIVVHFMSDRFRKPDAPYEFESLVNIFIEYGVSAHYLIGRDGGVVRLVPEEKKAWHAGGSVMPEPDSRVGVNDFSIGIELAGSELESFTDEQYHSLNAVIKSVKSRHSITTILGHEDISGERAVELGLRRDVKVDPGVHFQWGKVL